MLVFSMYGAYLGINYNSFFYQLWLLTVVYNKIVTDVGLTDLYRVHFSHSS